jgi:hypothetical protein
MHSCKQYPVFLAVLLTVIVVFTAGCTNTAPVSVPGATGSTAATVSPQVTSPASPTSIAGVWTGTTTGHTRADGFRETDTPRYNITAQKGMAFTGYKDFTRANGIVYHENLSGVISRDGNIYVAGENNDIMVGKFLGPDEVESRLIQPGEDAKALIIQLTR